MRAQARMLADGRRLHLLDGPIDIVLEAFGQQDQVQLAYRAAIHRFGTILDELCSELPLLRQQAESLGGRPRGNIAQRMFEAVLPFAESSFITPMAAVAGAVAEEVLNAMTASACISKAYVNDGGDIALHLTPGEQFVIGMIEQPDRPSMFGSTSVDSMCGVRGVATSGWRGRSFSLGIADAVTVLAATASKADAAATIIANAVDLPNHPQIQRKPAIELAPENDLGSRLVTTAVGKLTRREVRLALESGAACAKSMIASGLIESAALNLQGITYVVPRYSVEMSESRDRRLVHA
jgi:ApbE superfamily uncharacterized protein (UPF0280 family)